MATYRNETARFRAQILKIINLHHRDLQDAAVTVEVLMAFGPRNESTGEITGPALKHAGRPCCAMASINSLAQRVAGCADCRIRLDGDNWEDWSAEKQAAILDHELMHFELRRDQDGTIQLDDANRPKLRLRPHDWECKGFDAIIDRHGMNAVEAAAAVDLNKRLTQREFCWG